MTHHVYGERHEAAPWRTAVCGGQRVRPGSPGGCRAGAAEEGQLYEAFVATGLFPPTQLNTVPRTIFDDSGANNFYDQIAWFSEPDGTPLLDGIAYNQRAGSFDFIPHVVTGLTKNEVSWRISDHHPFWAEFRLGQA